MESIKVLAVLGKMCVSESWRDQFFEAPEATANALVGALNENELMQVLDLGGLGPLPGDWSNRADFVSAVQNALNDVRILYACPQRPCPRGD